MTQTAADFRRHMNLSEDYTVDGLFAYGTWDIDADKNHLPLLKKALDAQNISYTLKRMDHHSLGHCFELNMDEKRYWFAPVMGTAVMSTYIHVASLLGSQRNILLGIVGGLAPGMKVGDYVIPTGVVGNDNSRYYDRENLSNIHHPDKELLNLLQSHSFSAPVWTGTTITCEMMLAETAGDVANWSQAGYLGVEMEAALIFAASKHFCIPSVSLLYVADNLIAEETMMSAEYSSHKEYRLSIAHEQYQIGLSLLRS